MFKWVGVGGSSPATNLEINNAKANATANQVMTNANQVMTNANGNQVMTSANGNPVMTSAKPAVVRHSPRNIKQATSYLRENSRKFKAARDAKAKATKASGVAKHSGAAKRSRVAKRSGAARALVNASKTDKQGTYHRRGILIDFILGNNNMNKYNTNTSYKLRNYFKLTEQDNKGKSLSNNRQNEQIKIDLDFIQTQQFFKLLAQDAVHDKLTIKNNKQISSVIKDIAFFTENTPAQKKQVTALIKSLRLNGNSEIPSNPETIAIANHFTTDNNHKIGKIAYDKNLTTHVGILDRAEKIPYIYDQAQGFVKTTLTPSMFREVSSLASIGDPGNTLRDIYKAGLSSKQINLLKPIVFDIKGKDIDGKVFTIFKGIINFYPDYQYHASAKSKVFKSGSVGVFMEKCCFPYFNNTFTPLISQGDSQQSRNLVGKFFGDFSQILTALSYDVTFVTGDKMAIAMYMFLTKVSKYPRKLIAELGQQTNKKRLTTPQSVDIFFDAGNKNSQKEQFIVLNAYVNPTPPNRGRRSNNTTTNNKSFINIVKRQLNLKREPTLDEVTRYARNAITRTRNRKGV